MLINKNEIDYFWVVQADPVGQVCRWNGKIIRIISDDYKLHVLRLFESGVIEKVVRENLLVDTKISDYHLSENDLILEHHVINNSVNATNWSFEMLKDAALLALKLNIILNQFGYELKDCHYDNIMFEGCRPLFIDFGSIVKKTSVAMGWLAYEDFMQCYWYPIQLWHKGYPNMVQSLIGNWRKRNLMEMRYIYFSALPHKLVRFYWELFAKVGKIRPVGYASNSSLRRIIHKIEGLLDERDTFWGDYQSDFWTKSELGTRFDISIEVLKKYEEDIHSAIEVGANQGYFSWLVARRTTISQIQATDYDEKAVNMMYHQLKKRVEEGNEITPFVLDFAMEPIEELKKYKADIVIANALIHHLIITQKIEVSKLIERFSALTSKYILVEFMPLGLWSKGVHGARKPKWYNLDWFLGKLEEKFEILHVEKIQKNRVLIIGKRKNNVQER